MRETAREWLRDRRARGYVRESTKAQGKDDRFGPEIQRHAQHEAAARFGMREPSMAYVDLVSGTGALKRSDFQRMIADARSRQFDVLLVYDVSRFARNETDAWVYLDALRDAGVAVYFCDEDILTVVDDDWRDRIGEVINAAAAYSRRLSRNLKRGLERKRARGLYVGGLPWGYRVRADGAALEPADPAVVVIRLRLWELYATGAWTYATLADQLNREGLRITWRGVERQFRTWTVQEVLESRVDLEHGGLDPSTFDAATRIRSQRASAIQKPGQRRRTYLFAGVARCGECGESFWGRMNHQPRRPRPYPQLYHSPRGCRRGVRNEEKLASEFGAWLQTWRIAPGDRTRIARYLAARPRDDLRETKRRTLEAELARLRNLYRWNDIAEPEYLAERRRAQRALDELGPDPVVRTPPAEAIRLASEMGTAWNRVSPETRRRFLEEWFEQVLIHKDQRVVIVPREPYAAIVFAAVGTAGGRPNASAVPTFEVSGLAEWLAFWASEATA